MHGGNTAPSIWWWALGYFAAYAPYAALTKLATSGALIAGSGARPPTGLELLPVTVMAAVVAAYAYLGATGWWRHAVPRGARVPRPGWATALSGVCSAGIIATTTLAYTFEGVSIVFVMLLMRGGLLILAPLIDAVAGRHVRWFSWIALALSIGSLLVAFSGGTAAISLICALDVALYLTCYFVRLSLMSRLAKSADPGANLRYFVEEQLVSSPSLLIGLAIAALAGSGELATGFTDFFARPGWMWGVAIGVLSQGTGIFGGLILLDRRENSFCIPVNRASSVLAGVVGSYGLYWFLGGSPVRDSELQGALLIIAAIAFLTVPPAIGKRRALAHAT
jgi:hypothetical protein